MTRIKKGPSQSVSIENVAERAGVSITTVSRVINKIPTVKEKHRLKVLEVIKELNYEPSVLAQRLATGKSNVVALVIPRYEGIFYSFYALELIKGIGTLCEASKLDLLLHLVDSNTPINFKGVGGIIFADIIGNRNQLDSALEKNIPCVVINNYVEDADVSCIAVDNLGGSEKAVEYLLKLGHRRVAHITGDVVTQAAAWRLKGYRMALEKYGIPVEEELIFKTDYSRGQARQAAEQLLGMKDMPTAVFVASDSMALEVMTVAKESGKEIPRDLSIIGFDDNPSGLYGPVALTTVRQPLLKMAQEAVEELKNIMDPLKKKSKPRKVVLATELVIRESCQSLTTKAQSQ